MFDRLHVKGMRRLVDVDLPLKALNVVVGPNGSGKSTLLQALELLARSARGELGRTISSFGGVASVLSALGSSDGLELSLDAGAEVEYSMTLAATGASYEIRAELLGYWAHGTAYPERRRLLMTRGAISSAGSDLDSLSQIRAAEWQPKESETALSQLPRAFKKAIEFRQRLESLVFFHSLDVSERSPVRLPQRMEPASYPEPNGDGLASALFSMRETDSERFNRLEESLRVAFPRFLRLEFLPVAAGMLSLAWRETGTTRSFYANELSEGTLRFLWLAALLLSPKPPSLIVLDEPEVSLHPEMLRELVELMREASQRCQILVSTHSESLVRFLTPDELVIFEIDENGAAVCRRGTDFNLDEWLKVYSLEQLWTSKRLDPTAVL